MAGHMKNRRSFLLERAKINCFMLLFLNVIQITNQHTGSQVINLTENQESVMTGPNQFCFHNSIIPGWKQTWTRIQVRVWSLRQLKVTVAEDEERLQELERFSVWGLMRHFMREQSNETILNVNLFNKKTCFKVDPVDHNIQYTVRPFHKFDIYLFMVFISGVFLFIYADWLSRSQVFYYSAGISTGMIASLIILIFIMARFLPKKSPFYVLIVGGWSFSIYVIQLVCRNLQLILKEHWHLALSYTAVVCFISFAVCYRHGPLVEERSINILSWTLQLFGLLLIYAGIQVQQVALAIILSALCAKNLEYPVSLALAVWRKIKPSIRWKLEPRRLLTEDEYQKEAEEETYRALEELRNHCNSPDFNTWKTVSRLQSPKRFADFAKGSPHLLSNEVSVHAQEYGFGGTYFEDELFATDEEYEDNEEDHKPVTDYD